jgi:hypothetical protein
MATYTDESQPAVIQLMSFEAGRRTIPCTFHGMEGKRLHLETGERLPASCPVTVKYSDALFLGEVVNSTAAGEEKWSVKIAVEQILTGLESLINLRANLLGDSAPVNPLAAVRSVVSLAK